MRLPALSPQSMRALLVLLITNGARGQAAVWARGQRQLNRSHFEGAHATYAEQRARVQAAVGNYSFYVYEGGAFDAITTALPQQRRHYKIAEELVEVWVHRALLNDKRRTTNPDDASLFFVPAYLSLSKSFDGQGHDARLENLIEALRSSKWFQRHRGADHVFGYSSINPGVARQLLFPKLHAGLEQSYFGVFEMNPAWVGGDRKEETLQRMVPAPYVVDAARLAGTSTQLHNHEISVFFAAHRRPNAAQWSGCDRSKALGLQSVPRSSIHIKQHRRRLLDEDAFAHSMRVADFCLVMCGDTPTSRRIFDAIVAGNAVPILGSSLREDSRLIKNVVENDTPVYIALDPDAEKKALKLIKKLLTFDIELYKVNIAPYSDVGEMSKQEYQKRKAQATLMNQESFLVNAIASI